MSNFRSPPEGAILITGASRGIGRAVALRLAGEGRPIVINYRASLDAAENVVATLESLGCDAIALPCDMADRHQAGQLFEDAERAVGPISIVINNAGITRDRLLVQMTDEDWFATWDTDLSGPRALATRAAGTMASRGGGRIVNVSSVVGVTGNAGQANYAAAKSAIQGLTREFGARWAGNNVLVNCIVPGFITTDATAHLNGEQRDRWLQRIPIRRFATSDEVADLAAFLVGPGGSYIAGQCIAVDGGYTAGAESAPPLPGMTTA